jgi:hypothetical protein
VSGNINNNSRSSSLIQRLAEGLSDCGENLPFCGGAPLRNASPNTPIAVWSCWEPGTVFVAQRHDHRGTARQITGQRSRHFWQKSISAILILVVGDWGGPGLISACAWSRIFINPVSRYAGKPGEPESDAAGCVWCSCSPLRVCSVPGISENIRSRFSPCAAAQLAHRPWLVGMQTLLKNFVSGHHLPLRAAVPRGARARRQAGKRRQTVVGVGIRSSVLPAMGRHRKRLIPISTLLETSVTNWNLLTNRKVAFQHTGTVGVGIMGLPDTRPGSCNC